MFQIENKEDCCGCAACVQSCPVSCIRMEEDGEGFFYPVVDESMCIDCGACEKVCPVRNPYPPRVPKRACAVRSNDSSVRESSSSGGLFMELARRVLARGGVVFGVRFTDKWTVGYGIAETEEELAAFRGSKYVECATGDCFERAQAFLREGRWVLFSGTSCRIAALNRFLRKEYDRLLTVEVVCHGVPSAKLWRAYLVYLTGGHPELVRNVNFRSKETGWKNYSFVCEWGHRRLQEPFRKNAYMRGFLSDSLLRPSCYSCACKMFASESDLTLADYWGAWHLQPEADDDRGTGLAFIHTEKAAEILQSLNVSSCAVTAPFEKLQTYNPAIGQPVRRPMKIKRRLFYRGLSMGLPFPLLVNIILRKRGIVGTLKRFLKRKRI